jgi:7-cyano-7-deazaguanine reductase
MAVRSKKRVRPLAGLDRRYDTDPVSSIDAGVLDTFPYEYPGESEVIRIDTDEFTAVCPYSGLPDFGTIRIDYVPARSIVELRSLKYYLFSYRNVGIYQEHVVNRVLRDLARCCDPRWMRVEVDYNIRGGVHTTVFRERGKKNKGVANAR